MIKVRIDTGSDVRVGEYDEVRVRIRRLMQGDELKEFNFSHPCSVVAIVLVKKRGTENSKLIHKGEKLFIEWDEVKL